MACLPGGPQNPVRNMSKVRAWAPEPTKLEKWWLLSYRIWLRKSLLMNAMFKRRLGTYIVVLDFSKEGLNQLLSSSHNCRPWQSTAKGGEENGEMGGDRHTVWGQWLLFRATLSETLLWDLEQKFYCLLSFLYFSRKHWILEDYYYYYLHKQVDSAPWYSPS